jgi:hypothetical protein
LLIVLTEPGAQIAVNGREVGRAPGDGQFERTLPAGRYKVSVTGGEGYLPFTADVALSAGSREVVTARLTTATGGVEITLPRIDGATILVDGLPVARLSRDADRTVRVEVIADGDGTRPPYEVSFNEARETLLIDKLSPGEHTFAFRHPEYATVERPVAVTAGSTHLLPIRAEAVGATLEVTSEAAASVYLDDALVGETGADGRFGLEGIAPGDHRVRIAKKGFQAVEERRSFAATKATRIERRLDPAITTAGFSDTFDVSLSRWTAPSTGWSLSAGSLRVEKSPTVGMPAGIVYKDFVWSFNLTTLGDSGAAWAVRARDASNYYLFYLSGPKGRFPNRFLTYVVEGGKLDLATPAANPVRVTSEMGVGREYYVEITVVGNTVNTRITPLATGVVENLGTFRDADNTFPHGGFGFRTVGDESFAVDELFADPPR